MATRYVQTNELTNEWTNMAGQPENIIPSTILQGGVGIIKS